MRHVEASCRASSPRYLVTAGGIQAAQAEPLRIGYLIWVGNGPLFVAQEKGFFAQEGVEVELINMAIHEAMYAGLFAGQIDVITATVDDMLPNFDPEQPYVCVLALTESLRRRRHRRQQRHSVHRRSQGQDGGVRRAHACRSST